jgi:hypothetical protein
MFFVSSKWTLFHIPHQNSLHYIFLRLRELFLSFFHLRRFWYILPLCNIIHSTTNDWLCCKIWGSIVLIPNIREFRNSICLNNPPYVCINSIKFASKKIWSTTLVFPLAITQSMLHICSFTHSLIYPLTTQDTATDPLTTTIPRESTSYHSKISLTYKFQSKIMVRLSIWTTVIFHTMSHIWEKLLDSTQASQYVWITLNWYEPNLNSHDKPKSKPPIPDVTTSHKLVCKKHVDAQTDAASNHALILCTLCKDHIKQLTWDMREKPVPRTDQILCRLNVSHWYFQLKTNFWWLALFIIRDVRSWINYVILNCKQRRSHQWFRHCNPKDM